VIAVLLVVVGPAGQTTTNSIAMFTVVCCGALSCHLPSDLYVHIFWENFHTFLLLSFMVPVLTMSLSLIITLICIAEKNE